MHQVIVRQGKAEVHETPAPVVDEGTVLVQTRASCISVGTEMSGLRSSGMPLWKRALKEPHNLKRGLQAVSDYGLRRTWSIVQGHVGGGQPSGYSLSGRVVAVGTGVTEFAVGDRVACAGAQSAHHAEFVSVPANLVVPVPDDLGWNEASTVTLGAIAMQGVRRAQPTLGETFIVIGLGVLGQIAAQLLKANGCRVVGSDLDRGRIKTALSLGMDAGVHPEDGVPVDQVARLTDGYGADGVIITAATPSDEVVSTAFQMCRKKGRVVLVGDVGLHLNRRDFYEKEIDFLISTSYGPGRYDRRYEEEGLDYPIGYVRWTENRNMREYLRLLAEKRVNVTPLVSATFPLEQAPQAYESLKRPDRPLMVLLTYKEEGASPATRVQLAPQAKPTEGVVNLALIGAGGHAKAIHLPNLRQLRDRFTLRAVMTRSGHNAASTAKQFEAAYATTRMEDVLEDKEVQAVLISTRHDLHADQAIAALAAGKHVLLEKPLALTREQATRVAAFYSSKKGAPPPILLTGFNRRFSPHAEAIRKKARARKAPLVITYRMNVGALPRDHWVQGPEGGGRNLAEACHIYDLFTSLVEAKVLRVTAVPIRPHSKHDLPTDNFVATIAFEDGSIATLTYTALGSKDLSKERMEVYCDGRVYVVDDYRDFEVHGGSGGFKARGMDKGQKAELEAFATGIRTGEWPIPLWQQLQATEISFQVEEQLRAGF